MTIWIHPSLHGFRRKHSTARGLIEIQCILTEALERGEYVAFIAIDCTGRFETTPHCMLLRVTKLLGCGNDELEWMLSYLENRRQVIEVIGAC